MASDSSTPRNEFFRQLKPKCISINDLAVRSADKKASAKDLIRVTEELSTIIEAQIAKDPSVLDEKLADYVFFPLSNILRNQPEYPIRLTELTIKCMRNLVQHGWKSKIPVELSQQLLILLTFIIGGVPGRERKDPVPEETELEAFKALGALVKSTGSSSAGAAALVDAKAIPALGHAISVLLDGVTDGRTHEIQLEALLTLDSLLEAIKDRSALATFLPGILSSLSKLLTPPQALKTRRVVLIKGISAVKDVLVKVLGDIHTMTILKEQEGLKTDDAASSEDNKVLTPSWLKATTAKVKLALVSILKLRTHDSDDVRSALRRLCIALLDECHRSLAESTSILVETAIILSGEHDEKASVFETSLTDLARVYPELGDTIKNTVYNWVTSLPRLVQTSEEKTKQQAIQNLSKGLYFVNDLQLDSSTLENTISASLRDTSTALLLGSKPGVLSELPSTPLELNTTDMITATGSTTFQPILMAQDNERPTRASIVNLISKIGEVSQQNRLANEMLDYTRESTGPSQVASYWLAFELVKSIHALSSEVDMFVNFASGAGSPDDSESTFHEIYSIAVSILDTQAEADEVDWRLHALALEVLTFTASRLRIDFRAELIDVLYPVTTFLGSSNSQVRSHAIVTLNNMASSCGYSNVTELVIDNVDYMVNSVSLRLNTFDISPASTQVLRMMIKLTGPKLIPYLDDVVAAIFAALDNYHGYTSFVESLFSVLIEVVHQGASSDYLLLEEVKASKIDHKKLMPQTSSKELLDILSKRLDRRKRLKEDLEHEDVGHYPERPWKATKTAGELLDEAEQEPDDEQEHHDAAVEKQPPPKTPTFQLLSRITNLTQHYLTSPSPGLRKALLDLLSIVCPALSPDEEAFLPLVNSIWPVLSERLYDPEIFVVVSACKALSTLCQSAGDFLSTRIKTEWWDGLGKWCTRAKAEAAQLKRNPKAKSNEGGIVLPAQTAQGTRPITTVATKSNAGLGKFTQAAQAWEAAQNLLVSISTFVRIDDAIFDQILDLLADILVSNPEARSALEAIDADAVWLHMYEQGAIEPPKQPFMTEASFVKLF